VAKALNGISIAREGNGGKNDANAFEANDAKEGQNSPCDVLEIQ